MRPLADIFGANKGSPPNIVADSIAAFGEFIGMAIFIFLALGGVQAGLEARRAGHSEALLTTDEIQSIAFSFGAAITVALFICGPMSGGVLNPAVLLSLVITGNINWLRGIFFFFAEIIGGIIGAYFANFVTANTLLGVNVLNPGFNYAQGFFAECLLTMCLCLTVLFVIVDKQSLADFAPFVVGTAIFICHMIGSPIDGTSVNPARSFAASIVTGTWTNQWIFWFGPLIGGIFASIIYLVCKVLSTDSQGDVLLQHAEQQRILNEKEARHKMDPFNKSINAVAAEPDSNLHTNYELSPNHDLSPAIGTPINHSPNLVNNSAPYRPADPSVSNINNPNVSNDVSASNTLNNSGRRSPNAINAVNV